MRLATRYYGVAYGYSKGIDIVKDMGGGFLQIPDVPFPRRSGRLHQPAAPSNRL
ncbi:hypothetical protein ACSLNJ_25035 [Escherichia coli]